MIPSEPPRHATTMIWENAVLDTATIALANGNPGHSRCFVLSTGRPTGPISLIGRGTRSSDLSKRLSKEKIQHVRQKHAVFKLVEKNKSVGRSLRKTNVFAVLSSKNIKTISLKQKNNWKCLSQIRQSCTPTYKSIGPAGLPVPSFPFPQHV